jgi:hypothetical protein
MAIRKMKACNVALDSRYTVREEFSGAASIVWVAYFCDERLGESAEHSEAVDSAVVHRAKFLAWCEDNAKPVKKD